MHRLTEENLAFLKGKSWVSATEPYIKDIDKIYMKLREYENTGLRPEEIEKLKTSNTQHHSQSSDWVSTKDRLPDKHDMYIVAWTDETIPAPPNEIHFYEMLEFDKDGWDFFDTVLDENSTVIAWQPLPKPYCEVKND